MKRVHVKAIKIQLTVCQIIKNTWQLGEIIINCFWELHFLLTREWWWKAQLKDRLKERRAMVNLTSVCFNQGNWRVSTSGTWKGNCSYKMWWETFCPWKQLHTGFKGQSRKGWMWAPSVATGVSEIFGNEEEVNRKAVDLVLWRKPVNVTCRSICILKNENSTDMTGLNTEVHRRKKNYWY